MREEVLTHRLVLNCIYVAQKQILLLYFNKFYALKNKLQRKIILKVF